MNTLKRHVFATLIASQGIHLLCCVLPLVLSVFSLIGGVSLSFLPFTGDELHHLMHDYEIPLLIFSATMLILGWGLHIYSKRLNCHDTIDECHDHEPCAPRRKKTEWAMIGATILFTINFAVWLFLH